MDILAVLGSPNREGNTARLLSAVVEGAEAGGARIRHIDISDYNVKPVWPGYFSDVMNGTTDTAGDDMPKLAKMMLRADIILLACPIYWYQLPGPLKTFVDRWSDFLTADFSSELAGTGLALATSHSGLGLMKSSAYLQLAMAGTAAFLGMKWLGAVETPGSLPGFDGPAEAHYELARLFGAKLALGKNEIGQVAIEETE